MNFADEHYVRSYTRDTINWKMLPWESKCVLKLLERKLDRAGVLDLGDFADNMVSVVAMLIELPEPVVAVGLAAILKQGTVVVHGRFLVEPNFTEAQEAIQSDRLRKAESRARHRDRSLAIARGLVTPRDNEQPEPDQTNGATAVTERDELSADESTQRDLPSQSVTECPPDPDRSPGPPPRGHSSRAEPSLAEPNRAERADTLRDTNGTPGSILRELRRHPSLSAVATLPVAEMLARRFATAELQRGVKLAWFIAAIGDCADDSSSGGFTAEALTKKLRAYGDHARAPTKGNGTARQVERDAVIEPKPSTPEQEAAQRKRAEERIAKQKQQRELQHGKDPKNAD